MLLLKTIRLENLLQIGMFQHNSDEAELAITEHAELDGRLIQFNREENRHHAQCTSSKARIEKCSCAVTVRFGEQTIENVDDKMLGQHLTKISPHDCNIFREGPLLTQTILAQT